ncbi:methylenetetrahydrofolate reductase [Mesorhizobium sp. M0976]|uniref:methylenetetrahydrofolate reductase n=1 Tax=unclassified Mesorhizobium TaxID=325217 RepID=UPI0033372875
MPERKLCAAPEPAASAGLVRRDISIELAPAQVAGFRPIASSFPYGSRVFLTHLEGKPIALQVEAAKQLLEAGFIPVPHIGARHFATERDFRDLVLAHSRNGVSEALLVGGNPLLARGPLDNAAALLSHPVLADSTIRTAFIGGYPEGHPVIPANALTAALAQKIAICGERGLRPRLVSQFAFDGGAIGIWTAEIQRNYPDLPIHIGLAGVTSLAKLIKFGMLCGVGPSLAMLRRSAAGLFNILADKNPGDVIHAIEAHRPSGSFHLHFYPFGGWEKTLAWVAEHQMSTAVHPTHHIGESR